MNDDKNSQTRKNEHGAICPQCGRAGMTCEIFVDEETFEKVWRHTCPACGHVAEHRH